MNFGNIVSLSITVISFIITLSIYIWRLSAMNSVVSENKKDIDNIGEKVREMDKNNITYRELISEQLHTINICIARFETKLDILLDEKRAVNKEHTNG